MLANIQPTASSSNTTYTESVISTLFETASSMAASIAVSNSSKQARVVSEVEQNIAVDSDAESVNTTVAVVFGPVVKMKKAQQKKSDGHGAGSD